MSTVIGIFTDRADVEDLVDQLKDEGFHPQDMSIVMRHADEEGGYETSGDVATGTVSGLTTGAIIGGIAGVIAATVLPGLGALFIAGPIATALGLGGAAATTAAGAITGAAAGGLIGALSSLGLSEDDAKKYEERVREGGILVAVPTSHNEEQVVAFFDEYGAEDVKTITNDEEVSIREEAVPTRHYAFAKGGKAHAKSSRKSTRLKTRS
jgi:uncharacterized membrane protein